MRSAGEPEVGDVTRQRGGHRASPSRWRSSPTSAARRTTARARPSWRRVHYEQDYDNAFWDGTQLVFGDGDGQVFDRFTKPIDVLGHELSHAVTQFTADLTYEGQSGALNESVSDVFGACIKQRHLGQDAADADWLVGEGIFLPGINGRALRSMSEPGTAYDDPQIGKDPQVGSMADYVETTDDNGGVHLNSGIPNRAFVLAARAIGGESWSGAGRIWYAALTSGLGATATSPPSRPRRSRPPGRHAGASSEAWTQRGRHARQRRPGPPPAGDPRHGSVGRGRPQRVASPGSPRRAPSTSTPTTPARPRCAELVHRIDFAAVARRQAAARPLRLPVPLRRASRPRCTSRTSPTTCASSPGSCWRSSESAAVAAGAGSLADRPGCNAVFWTLSAPYTPCSASITPRYSAERRSSPCGPGRRSWRGRGRRGGPCGSGRRRG